VILTFGSQYQPEFSSLQIFTMMAIIKSIYWMVKQQPLSSSAAVGAKGKKRTGSVFVHYVAKY
jgi:hypothetical protein